MESSIKVAKGLGAHVQGTVCYTISPVHTVEKYVELAKQLEELECDSICIKDMAGLLSPNDATRIISSMKKRNLHSDFSALPLHFWNGSNELYGSL